MPQHEPSNPELADRLDRLEGNLAERLDALRIQVSRMEDKVVWRDTYRADLRATDRRFQTVEEDVDDLDSSQRWLRRAVLAEVILPIIVLVVGAILVANLGAA